jgi:hypothetical protein
VGEYGVSRRHALGGRFARVATSLRAVGRAVEIVDVSIDAGELVHVADLAIADVATPDKTRAASRDVGAARGLPTGAS